MAKYLDERGDRASATHDADRENFDAREARQGSLGVRVLAVLTAGLFLALVVWGAVELWGESSDNDQATQTEQIQPSPSPEQTGSINEPAPAGGQALTPTDRDPTAQTGTGGESQQVSPDGTEK